MAQLKHPDWLVPRGPEQEFQPVTTTTRGRGGYFAVVMWWNPEGFWEPWDTAEGRHENLEPAIEDAKELARDLGIQYQPYGV